MSFLFVCCPRLSLISVIVLFLFVLGCSEDAPLGPSHFSSFCLFSPPTAKKRIILRPNQELRKYEISSNWLQSMFLFHVTMCDMVTSLILSLGIRLMVQLPHPILLHPFFQQSLVCQTWFKPNYSNQVKFVNPVQTKLLQSSPICQPWTKPKCPTKFNLSKLKQNFPTKSNLSEHQLGLQDVRVLKHFILEDNTKVLEVIEHQTCTYLLVHSRINSTLIVRN